MRPFRFMSWAAVLLALILTLAGHTAWAQTTFGSVVGQVTDPSGAGLPTATVTLTNNATGDTRPGALSDTGEYQFLSLDPGRYTLTVTGKGFKRFVQNPVEVQVAQATRVNVSLQLGGETEQVTVTAEAPVMQTDSANLGQVVEGKSVTDMPLNGRNALALVGLIPGVVPQGSSGGNLTGQNVFAAGNYQIGGGAANQSSTLYDGAPVNISYGNATELVPDQDTIQEFRVQTNNNTAEYGMYTGGVINISSKSGGNAIHGTVYEFDRNTVLNATPFFSKHTPGVILPKNPYHLNQFGGNVGFPIIKDKLFGFFDYQGFRNATAKTYTYTVPTNLMRQGNFSELCTNGYNASGVCNPAVKSTDYSVNLYDPCGGTVGPGQPCPNYTGNRTLFANGIIPSTRLSTVAQNLVKFPYWAAPTNSGVLNNYVAEANSGGTNDQYNGRVDFHLGQKQNLFGRYTQWNSQNIGAQPYKNGLLGGDPVSPEGFKTRQVVFGDTYLFNPSTIGDLHLSYTRWTYARIPGTLGYNENQLGFNPASGFGNIAALNNLSPSTTVPAITLTNPTYNNVGTGLITSINQNYAIAPTFTKTWKNHTIKVGADLRRLEELYFQNNNPGGTFAFDNSMTGPNRGNNTQTQGGWSFASFMLGYLGTGTSSVQIAPSTYNTIYYQGYYVQDNWVASPKLTINYGIRYEIPGVYRERHGWQATFNPTEVNTAASVNGQTPLGAFDLVNTAQHPESGLRNEHFTDFSPRIGISYRINDKTVIRGGFGTFFIPSDLQFPESPVQSAVSYIVNNATYSANSNQTPAVDLDNPLPNGPVGAPHRSPTYQKALLGGTANAVFQNEPNGYTRQWNFAVQRQLPAGIALELAYAGSHGVNLPVSIGINQLSDSYLAQAAADPTCSPAGGGAPTSGCFITKSVTNPFYGTAQQGTISTNANVSQNYLLRPFPQYGSIANTGHYAGFSNYNALEAKVEKRFNGGGVILGSYTFSKYMTNAESLTSWLESAGAAAGYQDTNNLAGEYALSGYDSKQRLTISYVYALPFGRGQHWGSDVHGVLGGFVSGWGFNGVTTLQEGFPLGLTMATNNIGTYMLQGTTRPNVAPGCDRYTHGPAWTRLGTANNSQQNWFNVGCFTAPATFSYGNESRSDSVLRGSGIADWDLALYKDTHLTEKIVLQLRVESFNLFNRAQFYMPVETIGSSSQGQITNTANDPRELQLGGRINF